MNRNVYLVVTFIAAALIAIVCVILLSGGDDESSEPGQQTETPKSATADTAPSKGDVAASEGKPTAAVKARPKRMDEAAKKARAEMLAAILDAISQSSAEKAKPRELSMDPGNASKSEQDLLQYIRGPLREIRPLLRGCYRRALSKDKSLSGAVRVKYSIVADEEHGGLVESSEILDSGDNTAIQAMGECLRETMYALRFEKPSGAGRITVEYPMVFTTGENTPEVPREQLKPKFEVEGFLPGE